MHVGYSDFFMSGVRAISKRTSQPRNSKPDGTADTCMASTSRMRSREEKSHVEEELARVNPAVVVRPVRLGKVIRSSSIAFSAPRERKPVAKRRRRWSLRSAQAEPAFAVVLAKRDEAAWDKSVAFVDPFHAVDPFSADERHSFYAESPAPRTKSQYASSFTPSTRVFEYESFLHLTDDDETDPFQPPSAVRSQYMRPSSAYSLTSVVEGTEQRWAGDASRPACTGRSAPTPPIHASAVKHSPPLARRKPRLSQDPLGGTHGCL